MKLKCVIIDDEYRGREVLAMLLRTHCPTINIIGMASNVSEGFDLIAAANPDVVFLDIEMPDGTGFDLLTKFPNPRFKTVFVTSYDQYAIKALRQHAFDYLLKPVIIDELKTTIAQLEGLYSGGLKQGADGILPVNHKTRLYHVKIRDIILLKGDGNYTYIYTKDQTYHTSRVLKEYESILCNVYEGFTRVHKSFIVNLQYVKSFEHGADQGLMLTNGMLVEVSRRKKEDVLTDLRKFSANSSDRNY